MARLGSASTNAALDLTRGGTGGTTAAEARTNLGLGTMATQAASAVAISGGTITGIGTPSSASDVAIKSYVDAVASALQVKAAVRVATTANITLSGEQTIDGVSVVAGDRVLVKDQSTGSQNGLYVCSAGAWSRSTDADTDAEVTTGLFTFVTAGTVNSNNGWILITPATIIVGTTALTFTQFSNAGDIIAGDGLTETGNTLNVIGGSGISVTADAVAVDTAVVATLSGTQALTNKTLDNTNTITVLDSIFTIQDNGDTSKQVKFQASGITASTTRTLTFQDVTGTIYVSGGTDIPVTDGGTGASTASDARTNLGLGTISTQNANAVSITGGDITGITDLAVADGGTAASTASGARTNLGLGTISTQDSNNVSITGGSITGITDLTIADGGTNQSTAGNRQFFIHAAGMWTSTTSGAAAIAKTETGSNKVNYQTLDFDQSTEEYAEFAVCMPDNWDASTVTYKIMWTAASGSGDIIWALQGTSLANDDAIDTAWGTAVTVTDTLTAAADLDVTPTSGAVTIGNAPSAGEYVQFRIYRDADAGGDTLNSDGKLIGIMIEYAVSAYGT